MMFRALFKTLFVMMLLFVSSETRGFGSDESGAQCIAGKLRGAALLHKRNENLYLSDPVQQLADIVRLRTGRNLTQPSERISAWLDYLQDSYDRHRDDPDVIARIKSHYESQYVTKLSDVPESFYDLQIRTARERGQGELKLDDKTKALSAQIALNDQKSSLNVWLDYFLSSDSESYPMWAKYWSFTGMTKLGKFDPESGTYSTRSKGQMSPFPDLNREALALVIDGVVKKVNGKSLEDISDPSLLNSLDGANFGKLYGRALQIVTEKKTDISSVEGQWVTYKQGSEPGPLVKSLGGMNTGWCTAGESTARAQLNGGDFHVFYSLDESGVPSIPRLAIRMEGNKIGEVRGIAKDQNLDEKIAGTPVLSNKLKEFGPEGASYLKKSAQMKELSVVEQKTQNETELSKDELRFLYEIDEPINGFGYQKDPRVSEIINKRNKRLDLARALGKKESELSLTKQDALRGGFPYHHGDLILDFIIAEKGAGRTLVLPKSVSGNLYIAMDVGDKSTVIVLPDSVGSNVSIQMLNKPLELPRSVGGSLHISFFNATAGGVVFPKSVGGDVTLQNLHTAVGLVLPDSVGGRIFLNNLKSTTGLVIPKTIRKDQIVLRRGLKLPL